MINGSEFSCLVFDDFYHDPHAIRQKAFDYSFVEPEDVTGYRSKQGYMPKGFKQQLQKLLGHKIKYLQRPLGTPHDNGTFFLSFAQGKIKEKPRPHYDDPLKDHVCLVYLSEDIPDDCGTSFFRHKRTGLEHFPKLKDLRELGINRKQAHEILERDSYYPNRWTETCRVGHKFNRAVIFPCSRLHAASKHYGGNMKNGRIYQIFTFELA